MQKSLAPIMSTTEAMPGTQLIWLESPQIASEAKPGQFIMVRCGEESVLPRPFSIHRVDGDRCALLFRTVGKGTRWLSQRKPGEVLSIFGPLGNGFALPDKAQHILLVAGGIGIAPLVFLAEEGTKQGMKLSLLMGASSAVHLLPTEESSSGLLTGGVLPWNINIEKVTDDGSEGFRGLVTHLIVNHPESADQIFACGPLPMYKTMAEMPQLKGKNVQVSLETRMGCGTGVCYGCTIRTKSGLKQVCRDGPVFRLHDVIWEEMVEV